MLAFIHPHLGIFQNDRAVRLMPDDDLVPSTWDLDRHTTRTTQLSDKRVCLLAQQVVIVVRLTNVSGVAQRSW